MKVLCIRCEKLKLKSGGPPTINVRPSDEGVTRHHQKLSHDEPSKSASYEFRIHLKNPLSFRI